MKKIIYSFSILIFIFILSCQDEKVEQLATQQQQNQEDEQQEDEQQNQEENPSNTKLLAGDSSKAWNIIKEEPEEEHPTCKSSSPISLDNAWIFFANGDFKFDHGDITTDPACDTVGCCDDIRSMTGTWEFLDNEEKLFVYLLHDTDDPDFILNDTFFVAPVMSLTADELILKDSTEGYKITFAPVE